MASFLDLTTGLPALWAKIKGLITQSDWEEDDTTSAAHVLNRPAVRAGEGTNSVVVGKIEDDEDTATYTLYLTGEANATVYNFITNDTLPSSLTSSLTNKQSLVYRPSAASNKYEQFDAIDLTNNTITFPYTLSKSNPITQEEIVIYYKKQSALGTRSLAEGVFTSATGVNSHAEGQYSKALGGNAHAEGMDAVAWGAFSHAEGQKTYARGATSHAEGFDVITTGNYSHAEGHATTASGVASHAEGSHSVASGEGSHVEGAYTIANHQGQHVFGEYNIADPSTAAADTHGNYIEIVGNGTAEDARSNAYTLDWSGNGWYAGKVTVGAQPTADMDVATKKYVDDIEIPQPEDDILVLNLLTEYGYAAPIADANGNVITEDDGTLVLG